MIDPDVQRLEELLLHDEDFPSNYVHMAHPEDYKMRTNPICEFIVHSRFGRHDRLIARVSWKIRSDAYMPIIFVCDTGAPSHLTLSSEALQILTENDILEQDERGTMYVKLQKNPTSTFLANVEETLHVHKHANIMGLEALKRLELHLTDAGFSFNKDFIHL